MGTPGFKADRLIRQSGSWAEYFAALAPLSRKQKGDAFERLVQLYLQTKPVYTSELSDVWLGREVPSGIRKKLNLPGPDEGIDLVARTRSGEFWAIQAKFKSDPEMAPTYRELSTFTNLAFVNCRGISLALVAHTSKRPVRKRKLLGNLTEIGLGDWLKSTDEDWALIHQLLRGKSPRPKKLTPRPHQKKAIRAAEKHFVGKEAARGRLVMPCGTGKSLTAFWIAEALEARTIVVLVPSLALIKQGIADWAREAVARNESPLPEWLCVCSDESTGKLDKDEFVSEVYDLGVPATTYVKEIGAFLAGSREGRRVVFATYQSSARLAEAARKVGAVFDLAILDEAHKTVGVKDKAFATPLFDENLPVKKRLFMTATERVLRGRNDEVVSMDDEDVYGALFHQLSFKDAIHAKPPIISDYRILTYAVTDDEVGEIIRDNRLVTDNEAEVSEAEARTIAAGIALRRAYEKHGIRHALSFHRSIRTASRFSDQQNAFTKADVFKPPVEAFHISSKKSAGQRADLLDEFEQSPCALMTNARCLTEGVDVPAIDCVLFADPKQSVVDIVQAAGRALRPHPEKSHGFIMLPVVVPSGMDFEAFADTTEFRQTARVITALSTQDERIAEEFRLKQYGQVPSGKIIEIDGSIAVGEKIDLGAFAEAIEARLWQSVAKANWRPFQDARAYARNRGLNNTSEWQAFSREGGLPDDIPSNPNRTYAASGWSGWGDWLGSGVVAASQRQYRSFKKARSFARSLGLKSQTEWFDFSKSGKLPPDIPANPNQIYKDNGWAGMGDWLGTFRVANQIRQYRSFRQARAFARSLGLKSGTEWRFFAKSGRLPQDIPAGPSRTYKQKGWVGMGDWLGTGNLGPGRREWRDFGRARLFAHALGLHSDSEWRDYAKSGRRPPDIPANPNLTYKDDGWAGMGDWLGTNAVAPKMRKFRPFSKAQVFARSLGLKSWPEWQAFAKSDQLPLDIPTNPNRTYKDKGWTGIGDWLGTGRSRKKRKGSD